jgi:hypothetical protein
MVSTEREGGRKASSVIIHPERANGSTMMQRRPRRTPEIPGDFTGDIAGVLSGFGAYPPFIRR